MLNRFVALCSSPTQTVNMGKRKALYRAAFSDVASLPTFGPSVDADSGHDSAKRGNNCILHEGSVTVYLAHQHDVNRFWEDSESNKRLKGADSATPATAKENATLSPQQLASVSFPYIAIDASRPASETVRAHLAAVTEALEQNRNAQMAKRQQQYMRGMFPQIGLHYPERRKLTKPMLTELVFETQQEIFDVVYRLWQLPERDYQIHALDILLHYEEMWAPKSLQNKRNCSEPIDAHNAVKFLVLFEYMIRHKSWWDTVDSISANMVGGLLGSPILCTNSDNGDPLVKRMYQWNEDVGSKWIRRTSILYQLKHAHNTVQPRLWGFIEACMHEREFFIEKSIGWALRQYSRHQPKEVRAFIELHRPRLAKLSIREGSKYC